MNNLFQTTLLCVVMIPEIKSVKTVSNKVLRSVWKRISDKSLPDVLAYTLTDKAFISNLKLLQKNGSVIDTRVKEYGMEIKNEFIEACTFEFEGHLVIFVRESVPLVDALEHELRHVVKWKHLDAHDGS
jgi:uncharacterized protein YjaZ